MCQVSSAKPPPVPTGSRDDRSGEPTALPFWKIRLAPLLRQRKVAALFGGGAFLAPAAPVQTEPITYLDIQDKANQKLTDGFHSGKEGNNLADLPTGKQTFADVKFSIGRGVIQLGSLKVKDKPEKVEGIKVGQKFDKLQRAHHVSLHHTPLATYLTSCITGP